jgi:hypothetical protein
LGDRQPCRRDRCRRFGQQFDCLRTVEVVEGVQGGREVLPQCLTQSQDMAGSLPNQRLVRPSQNFDPLGEVAVTSHRPQLVRIGADHVSQRVRITGIALRAGHGAAFAIPSDLRWVDRIHPISRCD